MPQKPEDVIKEIARRWERLKNSQLPKIVGNEVVNFALDNFKRQAFLGAAVQPWKKRKPVKGKSSGRALLVKSGRMRRSIRVKSANAEVVIVGAGTPYAKAHNYGNTEYTAVRFHNRNRYGTSKVYSLTEKTKSGARKSRTVKFSTGQSEVKAHMRQNRMPRRQFLGHSPYLNSKLQRSIGSAIMKAFKV